MGVEVFMPAVVTERPYRPVPTDPPRKRWTRLECVTLEESGLWDRLHLELVNGELISKMGKNRPHVNGLIVLQAWLIQVCPAASLRSGNASLGPSPLYFL